MKWTQERKASLMDKVRVPFDAAREVYHMTDRKGVDEKGLSLYPSLVR